jgi:hypothetical protein
MVAATPVAAEGDPVPAPACTDRGDGTITCPRLALERLRDAYLDATAAEARARAELDRCRADAADAEAAFGAACAARTRELADRVLASRPEPRRPATAILGGLAGLAAAAGGGACIASPTCSPAVGWSLIGTAAVATAASLLIP